MKLKKTFLPTLIALFCCAQSMAAPIEFDTKDAHVIVVRPVDAWSGDASVSEATLDAIRDKETHYGVVAISLKSGKSVELYGGADMFGGITNHPITKGVQAALLEKNMKLVKSGKSVFSVQGPIAVNPSEMEAITLAQTAFYKKFVISQGDPETLSGKVQGKKFFAGLLAIGTTFLAMDKLGAFVGSSATLGSGLTNDIYRIASKNRGALAPIILPNVDFTQYKNVDVRTVTGAADRMGQIIIAYKEEKTADAEQDALIQAIVVTAGADTTVAEVEKSRAIDLASRHVIWDACVVEGKGKCEND